MRKSYPTTPKQSNQSGARRRVTQNKSPSDNKQILQTMKCPLYAPIYSFHRVIESGYDITTDGINPSLVAMRFTLDILPNYLDFVRLFDLYKISKVEIEWLPEYTEFTDASVLSNAVNVRFNSAINLTDNSTPATVNEILEYQQVLSTGVTKSHKRSFKPATLMSGLIPCDCWIPTWQPSQPYYGLKIGIPATGVAMTFRARVKLHVECANVK